MIVSSFVDLVGNTPLVQFRLTEYPDVNFYVKLESFNPTGSIKDRACIYNIRSAIKNGELTKDKTILDASSGNMACALAFHGRLLGYKVKVVCNSKLTDDKKNFIKFFGADLDIIGDITIEGNHWCRELTQKEEGKNFCFLDQLHNPANPLASYETLGPEIHRDLPNISAVVGSMGSGGSMCGVARYFKEKKPDTLIFTSQAASGTKIPGTGAFVDGDYITPFIIELRNYYNDTFMINQSQAENRTKQLAMQGVYAGFQAGGVLEAAYQAIEKHKIKGDMVMIIGDAGWKNMDKLKTII
ncbi:MAG TPA: cysteine synthase family protein [Bacteroidia bacterium]|nr:cysteine synthase family protein [Bacteroidia bacterium]